MMLDCRLPTRCKWDLGSSGTLCSVPRYFFTDVSGQHIDPIFQGQAVQRSPRMLDPGRRDRYVFSKTSVAAKPRCVTSKKSQDLRYVQVNLSLLLMKHSEVKGIEVWRKSFRSAVKWSEVKCSDVRWIGAVGNLNGFEPNERVVKCSWAKFKWEDVKCRPV